MSNVAKNVKEIINSRGFKQGAVARTAGYSYQSFNNLVNGRKTITDEDIVILATVLNVTPNELFGIKPDTDISA